MESKSLQIILLTFFCGYVVCASTGQNNSVIHQSQILPASTENATTTLPATTKTIITTVYLNDTKDVTPKNSNISSSTSDNKAANGTTVPINVTPKANDTRIQNATAVPENKPATKINGGETTVMPQTTVHIENKTETTTPSSTTPSSTTTSSTTPSSPTKSSVSTSTEKTTVLPKVQEMQKDRQFDGPSFIGGIVLALGLTGIGFVAYNFCKSRTDRNYRHL